MSSHSGGGPSGSGPARPRVLRIITRLNVGGPSTHVLIADRGLRDRGWETLLVHGALEPDEVQVSLEGIDLPMSQLRTLVRPISPLNDARAAASLVRIIRAYRPHIIHTHLSKAGLLGRSAAIFSSRAGPHPHLPRNCLQRLLRRADVGHDPARRAHG